MQKIPDSALPPEVQRYLDAMIGLYKKVSGHPELQRAFLEQLREGNDWLRRASLAPSLPASSRLPIPPRQSSPNLPRQPNLWGHPPSPRDDTRVVFGGILRNRTTLGDDESHAGNGPDSANTLREGPGRASRHSKGCLFSGRPHTEEPPTLDQGQFFEFSTGTLSPNHDGPDPGDATGLGPSPTLRPPRPDHDKNKGLIRISNLINNTNLLDLFEAVVDNTRRLAPAGEVAKTPFMQWTEKFLKVHGVVPVEPAPTADVYQKVLERLVDIRGCLTRDPGVEGQVSRQSIKDDIQTRLAKARLGISLKKEFGVHVLLLLPDFNHEPLSTSDCEDIVRHLKARQQDQNDSFAADLKWAEDYLSQLYSKRPPFTALLSEFINIIKDVKIDQSRDRSTDD